MGPRSGDMPAIPVGSDRRDLAQPACSVARIIRSGPEALHPTVSCLDRLVRQRAGPYFHGLLTLGQCAGHIRIGDSSYPRDQPGDEVVGAPSPATGRLHPAINPSVEHRGHVEGVGQGPAGDQLREGRLDIQATGLGLAERGEQRTVRLA